MKYSFASRSRLLHQNPSRECEGEKACVQHPHGSKLPWGPRHFKVLSAVIAYENADKRAPLCKGSCRRRRLRDCLQFLPRYATI